MNPESLIELALKSGATVAEVYSVTAVSQPIYFEANRLKQIETLNSQGVALRLWQNHQPGLAIAYGDIEPQILVEKALGLSKLNAPEEILLNDRRVLAAQVKPAPDPLDHFIEKGQAAIATLTNQYPELICQCQLDHTYQSMRLLNSRGLDCRYSDQTISSSLSAELVRGDDFLNIWHSHSDRHSFSLDILTTPILQHLDWSRDNAPTSQGKMPILFTPKAADLLWDLVAGAFSAKQVQQKTTPWLHKLNQAVLSPQVTLSQDPNLGIYGVPFDDEGTITESHTWIEQGYLRGFYGDRRRCHELDLSPRGNGFRSGLGSYPSCGLFNLVVGDGNGSLAELIQSIDHGILVDQILGDSPDLSGDFAINIDLGYQIKQGQIVGRVKDTMVAGNVYTALNQIINLGGDHTWQGSLFTPSLVVNGLSVTG